MTVSSSIENFDAAAPITNAADVAAETVAVAAPEAAAVAIESTDSPVGVGS